MAEPTSPLDLDQRELSTPSKRLRSILESLLFAAGDPVPLGKLVQLLPGYEKRDVVRTLAELGEEYARDQRGFRLQQIAGGDQLPTSRAHAELGQALLPPRPLGLARAPPEKPAGVRLSRTPAP